MLPCTQKRPPILEELMQNVLDPRNRELVYERFHDCIFTCSGSLATLEYLPRLAFDELGQWPWEEQNAAVLSTL